MNDWMKSTRAILKGHEELLKGKEQLMTQTPSVSETASGRLRLLDKAMTGLALFSAEPLALGTLEHNAIEDYLSASGHREDMVGNSIAGCLVDQSTHPEFSCPLSTVEGECWCLYRVPTAHLPPAAAVAGSAPSALHCSPGSLSP